jgi:hypothetical protein
MSDLVTAPNMLDGDRFYAELLEAHQGLTPEQTHALNARLVLVLANHVGDAVALTQALAAARPAGPPTGGGDR